MKTSMIGNISVQQTPPKAMWQINANRQDYSRLKNNWLFDDKKKRYGNTQKVDYLWIHETTRVMRAAFCQQYQLLEALTIIQAFECEKKNDNKMRARSSDSKD